MEKFKVKITKSSGSGYWYKDKIGEVFEVVMCDDRDYGRDYQWVKEPDGVKYFIDKSDCEIVPIDGRQDGNMEETYKGYRLIKPITVKELILAGAQDSDTDWLLHYYKSPGRVKGYHICEPIPLEVAVDYCTKGDRACPEKLTWLIDHGFIGKETKLKPCPFCGLEKAEVFTSDELEDRNRASSGQWVAICDTRIGGCGGNGGYRPNKPDAVDAWNKRMSKL